MSDDFVENDENGLEITNGSEEDFRQNDELSSFVPDESPPVVDEVPSAPLVVVPDAPDLPVEDVLGEADYSLNDVLDAFASGLLSGVSDDESSDGQLAADPPDSLDVPLDVPVQTPEEPVCVGIETFSLSPVESAVGLKGILLDVLGPYDTVVTQYKYQQGSNQYYSYVNDIQPDYPWIASAVLFILLLCSLFRLLGRCFSWMR